MPGLLWSKIMKHTPVTLKQDFCTFTRQQMTISEMCEKKDYLEDGLNEASPSLSENLINALSELRVDQENMERQLKNMDEKVQANSETIDTNTIKNNDQFQNIKDQNLSLNTHITA